MKKMICGLFITTMLTNLTGCGTILYPERKGQKSGQIDPSILILDGVGLLFGVLPGVIAYAVDFSNGTIYLGGGKRADIDTPVDLKDMVAINVGKENLTKANIEKIIEEKTGEKVNLDSAKTFKIGANGEKVAVNNKVL